MSELVEPTTRLHGAFLSAGDDWGPGTHADGLGLHADDDVDTPEGLANGWLIERVHEPQLGRVRRSAVTLA